MEELNARELNSLRNSTRGVNLKKEVELLILERSLNADKGSFYGRTFLIFMSCTVLVRNTV